MSNIGRPKVKNKKMSISLTIDKDLNEKLEKYLEEKKLSKSEYIEFLIRKDQK